MLLIRRILSLDARRNLYLVPAWGLARRLVIQRAHQLAQSDQVRPAEVRALPPEANQRVLSGERSAVRWERDLAAVRTDEFDANGPEAVEGPDRRELETAQWMARVTDSMSLTTLVTIGRSPLRMP